MKIPGKHSDHALSTASGASDKEVVITADGVQPTDLTDLITFFRWCFQELDQYQNLGLKLKILTNETDIQSDMTVYRQRGRGMWTRLCQLSDVVVCGITVIAMGNLLFYLLYEQTKNMNTSKYNFFMFIYNVAP